MKQPWLVTILSLAAACLTASAGEIPIKVENAWIRAVPPGSPATAGYMTITNTGTESLSLTGGLSEIAKVVSPMVTVHRTVDGKEVSGMELVESLAIPAGKELVLKPGGDHLMFMEMDTQPSPGTTAKVVLQFKFDEGDTDRDLVEVEVTLPVARKAPEAK